MDLLEAVGSGQERVGGLRDELDRARDALDRTDAVLAFTNASLELAEVAIVAGRRWGRLAAIVVGVAVVGVVAYVVIKRRSSSDDANSD